MEKPSDHSSKTILWVTVVVGIVLSVVVWPLSQLGKGSADAGGADEAELHAQAGYRAKAAGVSRLFALGELSAHAATAFGEGGALFDSHAALTDAVAASLRPGVRVLVKGSRGSAMDRIVKALLQRDATDNGGDTTDAA